MIKDNISRIQEHIFSICNRLGRNPEDISLVGVTKFADIAAINEAIEAGLKHIAENKVQEGVRKFQSISLENTNITRHLIGHLQSNKAKIAVELFDMIESVDSLKIAESINKHAAAIDKKVSILVQVNTSGEEQKFGIPTSKALQTIEPISQLSHLEIKGLMVIAPLTDDTNVIRKCFKDCRMIHKIATDQLGLSMPILSMGMSADYEIALEEGSNMVRIGRAIFNE